VRTIGVYNLFADNPHEILDEAMKARLASIATHLGIAIEKARVDEQTGQMSIMEERTRIAHELHDSLAQSLASLRFQVRVLDETLHQGDESTTWQQLERIENSLDEANTELRELIAHFRAPVDERGLLAAIEQLVERFRKDTRIHTYLQKEWKQERFPPEVEIQILRIVQEALWNIRKHSQAKTVRIMLRNDNHGNYRILIEDDGIGIGEQIHGLPGEHVGLTIMQERATRVGGQLKIESEPGEGTRIVLTFTRASMNPEEGHHRQVVQ
jgi:two-component system nitrate/nitrite sensor histidine kinase NarX